MGLIMIILTYQSMLYSSIYPQPTINHHQHIQKEMHRIKYPQDIQAVIRCDRTNYGNLYLGNIEAAENTNLLQSLQITSVLSVAKGYDPNYSEQVRYKKYIPIQDGDNLDIHQHLHEGVQFITEKLLFTNVFVHCVAGVGRSACFVIAYLMKERRMNFQQAFLQAKSRRKMINLNKSMIEQLKKYEVDLMNQGHRKNKYSFSVRVNSNHNISHISPSYFQPDSFDDGSILAELYTNKDRVIEVDRVSKISRKSQKNPQQTSLKLQGKSKIITKTQNPQQKSMQMQEIPLIKKRSSSREQYQKKVNLVNSRNESINKSIMQLQQKYENQAKASKFTFKQLMNGNSSFREEARQGKDRLFKVFLQ